ncbi:MAG: GGDEF domain-containing protein, partial [Desulfobacterales bacterium]|nr:GGDEF domain-containing protein [Desulfobacterales bacterium]
ERFQSWLTDHPLVVDDVATPAFLSFGAASTRNKIIREPADLLKKADERLYMAKKRAST